jgi:hypothetical protein
LAVCVFGVSFALLSAPRVGEARTLRDRLSALTDTSSFLIQLVDDTGAVVGTFDPAPFAGQSDFFAPAVERLAILGSDFPVTSTIPGFSYVYNSQLQVMERSTQLGPVFAERAARSERTPELGPSSTQPVRCRWRGSHTSSLPPVTVDGAGQRSSRMSR